MIYLFDVLFEGSCEGCHLLNLEAVVLAFESGRAGLLEVSGVALLACLDIVCSD